MSGFRRLVRSAGLTPRPWRLASLFLALLAVLAALWNHPVLFDLRPGRYADAMAMFQGGRADVEIDSEVPEAHVPYILPGPADDWAGGRAHGLRIRHARSATGPLRLELHTAETHHAVPPRLLIAAEGWQVRRQLEPGTGLPPPHQDRGRRHVYRVRVPAREATGPGTLTITNEDSSWVMWERIRLVEAATSPAWAHLGRAEPLPWPSAALLAGSLILLGVAAVLTERSRGWTAALIGLGGPAVALGVGAVLLVVGAGRWPLRTVFAITVVCSVAAHSIGAFYDHWRWTYCTAYEVLGDRLWSWRDNQLASPVKRALVALSRLPTSETHPGLLAARYETDARPPLGVAASGSVRLAVTARNAGPAVWRAALDAPERGVVLHWHWRREPGGDPRAGGRALLCADTFPGEDAGFHILARTPEEAGVYVLELGLASGATTFEGLGTPLLRLPATVRAPDPS